MNRLILILWLSGCGTGVLYSQSFPNGKITERVFCSADSSQSYSLYLPSYYDSSKEWPIIYCFKPETDALLPLQWYSEIMETYGWIMVCSWNSQNGPWQVCLDAIHAVWKDTHKRFRIDPRRVYATGFSGGSRTASELGILYSNQVTGIIGNGAGFSASHELPQSIPFRYYYGLTGTLDYNHSEMTFVGEILEQKKLVHRIVYFDGYHQWAPPADFERGIEWMELQGIHDSIRVKDTVWIGKIFQDRRRVLDTLLLNHRVYDAAIHAEWMSEDFKGYMDVASLSTLSDSLKKTKDYAKWLEKIAFLRVKEVEFQNSFDKLLISWNEVNFNENTDPDFNKIMAESRDWQSRLKSKNVLESQAAYRCLNYVSRLSKSRGREYLKYDALKRAIGCFNLAIKMFPDDFMVYYFLASAQARAGETSSSIKLLEKAIKFGFADLGRLESDTNFDPLRQHKGYLKIIKELSAKDTTKP
ncbi:hypothetical protein K1X84_15935 [bacterium]|nr:hypothetical protein [bacterium]